MATTPEREKPPVDPTAESSVSAHKSSPDRTVFTEKGNSDAWIATDLTVALQQ